MQTILVTPAPFYGLLVRAHQPRRPPPLSAGLSLAPPSWLPLPLTSIDVSCAVFDFCSELQVTQTYSNPSPLCPLESEYVFPLDESSAICAFSAEVNGRVISGLVKEKQEARKEFARAKSAGKTALLCEQSAPNLFRLRIGNLPPAEEIKVRLTYVTTLDLQGKANRIVIPAVVAPKYEPKQYYGYGFDGSSSSSSSRGSGSEVASLSHTGDGYGASKVNLDGHSLNGSAIGSLSFFQSMTAQYLGQQPVVVLPAPALIAVPASAVTLTAKQQSVAPRESQ